MFRFKYCCISFHSLERTKYCAVRGLFETVDNANARARKLCKLNNNFNIFVCGVGEWTLYDFDLCDIEYREFDVNKCEVVTIDSKHLVGNTSDMNLVIPLLNDQVKCIKIECVHT